MEKIILYQRYDRRRRSFSSSVTGAAGLHLATERAYAEIIKAVVKLAAKQADQLEPVFTELEEQLFTLGTLRFRHSSD
jgi:hypothetical protein